jgi:hypothetical protein
MRGKLILIYQKGISLSRRSKKRRIKREKMNSQNLLSIFIIITTKKEEKILGGAREASLGKIVREKN